MDEEKLFNTASNVYSAHRKLIESIGKLGETFRIENKPKGVLKYFDFKDE